MSKADYTIGYGKPPAATQFKKGESGNPKGRKKGVRNLKTDLQEELQEMVALGSGKKISKQRALIKTGMTKALKGDLKAVTAMLSLMLKIIDPAGQPAGSAEGSANDLKTIQDFLLRHQAPPAGKTSSTENEGN